MEYSNSKEIEEQVVALDIESGEAIDHAKRDHSSSNNWGKASLNKLVVGVLGIRVGESSMKTSGSVDQKTELLVEQKNPGGGQDSHFTLVDKENDKERRKAKKAPKPPRPPRGPSLDAADMRLVKEISKIAIKRRERIERVKALKKMKEARLPSMPSSSSSSSPSLSSLGGTISAMLITVLFFLVLIFQVSGQLTRTSNAGLSSNTSSYLMMALHQVLCHLNLENSSVVQLHILTYCRNRENT